MKHYQVSTEITKADEVVTLAEAAVEFGYPKNTKTFETMLSIVYGDIDEEVEWLKRINMLFQI
jgi:hypothetical protein